MSEKTVRGFSTSIYVTDKQAFEECKRLLKLQGTSLSEEIMSFVLRRLGELRGTAEPGTSDEEVSRKYADLKDKHSKLRAQYKKRLKELKASSEFQKANDLLADVGLLADLSNAADIIPRFIAAWKKTHDDDGFMHEYVSFVELAVEKKQVEKLLASMQLAKYPRPDHDVATVTLAQPAMETMPATPQQNKQKTLIEEEGSRDEDLQEDENELEESTGEDDDEEESVEEGK